MTQTNLRVILLWLLMVFPAPSFATWSIVAVDPITRQVGIAAATCNFGIQFIAGTVPGSGVIAAQAETSLRGRDHAKALMIQGEGADNILVELQQSSLYEGWFTAKYPSLQYGVATLNPHPEAGFISGDEIFPWSGGIAGQNYAAQGNTLRSERVIEVSAATFEMTSEGSCQLSFSERLLRALEAGRDAGGDKRCLVEKPALSALLIVEPSPIETALPTTTHPSLRIVAPREISLIEGVYYLIMPANPAEDYADPIKLVRERYEAQGGTRCE